MGGKNFYIDFLGEGIIRGNEIFLIIGLDSKIENEKVIYSMTSTINSRLNNFITQEKACDNNTQEKNNALKAMFKKAIDEIKRRGCPHSPDYIIIYRQGGNEVHNKRLTINELDNFKGILNECRELYKGHFLNTKLYYICCNLKSDLKFFETEKRGVSKAYYNPKSGLIVDDNVTHKGKYEFYLQPQYVNQGTATPCHYQIMYYDKSKREEEELTIENLEKLSFYMSFYYWTWAGAIRTPSLLKMSNTAMTFYSKILKTNESNDYYFFEKPIYI
jgi:aubergine-like protein